MTYSVSSGMLNLTHSLTIITRVENGEDVIEPNLFVSC